MKRLQGKCFLASASLHLVLVLTVLLGSAFQNSQPTPEGTSPGQHREGPPLELTAMPAQTEAPAVGVAQAQPVLRTEPKVLSQDIPEVAPNQRDPNSFIPMARRPKLPHISTNLVSRPVIGARPTSNYQKTAAQSQAEQIGQALQRIGGLISPGTAIDLSGGTGSGTGSDVGNFSYAQIVREYYSRNWDPQSVTSEEGTGLVKVVIANDGKVIQARLITSSGDKALDASIQQALNRVQSIQPFEQGAREKQRTYTINFNAKTRALLP